MLRKSVLLHDQIREDSARATACAGLAAVFERIERAAKLIASEVRRASLVDLLGVTGATNTHGEAVKKLDEVANALLLEALRECPHVAGMASEEEDDFVETDHVDGEYLVLFDPLDGSSNIDANVSIGTIFSVLRRPRTDAALCLDDFLQRGRQQVAAGYVLYGPSTSFVYAAGHGVHGFTLDPESGEFTLSHPFMRIPDRGRVFSVNMGNYRVFDEEVGRYVSYLASAKNTSGQPYSLRYIGSLVADFHRSLLYGGVFLYPSDRKRPDGKLRLLYEANPLGLIVDQAGGRASNGYGNILRVQPLLLHQRVPLFLGSAEDVLEAESFVKSAQGVRARA